MTYSICIIDDGINQPAVENNIEETVLLNSSSISFLLKEQEHWGTEIPLYNLFKQLLDEKDDSGSKIWQVYAFTHPIFYIDNFEQELLRHDIIIFDWDYSPPVNHAEVLTNILENSYSLLYIYSGVGKETEVKQLVDSPNFSKFKDRIGYLDKCIEQGDASTSPSDLIGAVKEQYEKRFSFRFGKKLRNTTVKALDRILIRLGELQIEEALTFLGASENELLDVDFKQMLGEKIKNHLKEDSDLNAFLQTNNLNKDSSEQLIELVTEKIKDDVIATELEIEPSVKTDTISREEWEIAKELWSYRLYYNPSDDVVRKGDIVCKADREDCSSLFLVMTADCDLTYFWKKNLGYIILAKLYSIEAQKSYIKELGQLARRNKSLKNLPKITSMANSITSIGGSPLYFPFIQIQEKLVDYILFPKELISIPIAMPEERKTLTPIENRDTHLLYDYWKDHKRITTLSEPFLTPVIEHILSTIAGYGTPDYPQEMQEILANSYKSIFS